MSIIVLVPIVLGVLFSAPLAGEETLIDFITETCGWVFFIGYAVLRIWSTLYIGRRKEKKLQTEGPYSLCRNPLYLGSFCFALSAVFFLESFSLLIGVLIVATFYRFWVIPAEEQALCTVFGDDFYKYCQKIPRILPSLKLYATSPAIEVNMKGLRLEFKRLVIASLLPLCSELIMYCRCAGWWPHVLHLP